MAITQKDIIYFIVTDRFYGVPNQVPDPQINKSNPYYYHGGNLPGIIEKIPYLKRLGITALWITPVYLQLHLENVHGYHGYWALDFNKVDPHLYIDNGKYEAGSKLYLKDLVDTLHYHGIKLILDMVVNHTGYEHPARYDEANNPTPIRGHWFNQEGLSSYDCVIKGELSGLPDFNLDLPDVADYHIQSILDWIEETGIDAVRMDTVKHVERLFWQSFKTQVEGKYPDISLIGEVWEYSIEKISEFQKYWAFDSLFDFPMQQTIKDVFVYDNPMYKFVSAFNRGTGILERDHAYTNHNMLVTMLDNHDLEARFMTFALEKLNHDYKKASVLMRLALSFMFTIRGIPQVYYGTELGMEGYHDPDNRRDFEWEKIDDSLNVSPEYTYQKEIFDHTCRLIEVRKANEALTCGEFICLYVDYFLLVYLRYISDNVVIMVFHNGWLDMPEAININLEDNPHIPSRIKFLLQNKVLTCQLSGERVAVDDKGFSVKMPGKTSWILA